MLLRTILLFGACGIGSLCQIAPVLKDVSPPIRESKPLPLPLLYRHFLAYQNHLDRAAAAAERDGRDGNALRNYHQDKLAFNNGQFAAVRATALRLEAALKAQDAKAASVVKADRARFSQTPLPRAADLPPVPAELKQLQTERDAMIAAQVAALKAALGAEASTKLDAYLVSDFAPKLTVRFVDPSRGTRPDPRGQEFPREVRP